MYHVTQNHALELCFYSATGYKGPHADMELDVVFEGSGISRMVVPAFWAGENVWKVRFSAPTVGTYSYTSLCSDQQNVGLHKQKGKVEVHPYEGNNPLFSHGPLRVSGNRRYLEHIDGTPFFWLADTWWMGLCKRLTWPQDFRVLIKDRVEKGFTVIQLVAGLYPDMPPFDERGANEAGFPWQKDYARINPDYFNMADLRIEHLVSSGLAPCIVGAWGYFLPWMGVEKMKKHWRYLIARYGAYPVIWCLVGEALMPYYLSRNKDTEMKMQKQGWTAVARYVRQIEPFGRPMTIHPASLSSSRSQVEDSSLVDFDMLQTLHGDWFIIPEHVKTIVEAVNQQPRLPVLVGEVCYEGHGGCAWENMQRFVFWSSILSGACGHTYGACGIWQVNRKGEPFGPSPHGGTYSTIPWEEAYQSAASVQMGIAKRLLERYRWWQLEPHPEWTEPWPKSLRVEYRKFDRYFGCYAAGIPNELCIVYFPVQRNAQPVIKEFFGESNVTYQSFYYDPRTGREYPLGKVRPNEKGEWVAPCFPIFQDGILVVEKM